MILNNYTVRALLELFLVIIFQNTILLGHYAPSHIMMYKRIICIMLHHMLLSWNKGGDLPEPPPLHSQNPGYTIHKLYFLDE